MSALLQQLMRYKPAFLPAWCYRTLLVCGAVVGLVIAVLGFWFASTQIEFM